MAHTLTLTADDLQVLGSADVDGNIIRLTAQLDRKQYVRVNAVLEAMGGKWDKRVKGHTFPHDPEALLDNVLLTGEIDKPNRYDFFPTPPDICRFLCDLAELDSDMCILEPSAGDGALIAAIRQDTEPVYIAAFELDAVRAEALRTMPYRPDMGVTCGDFLQYIPIPEYDRVIMNPPFSKGQAVKHVTHAYDFLTPGGRLVAVMPSSITFRTDRLHAGFRDAFPAMQVKPLPPGAFKVSGTMVNTVIVVIDKPGV